MEFSEAHSGASLTFPVKCSALKKSGYVMINKRPGKIVQDSAKRRGLGCVNSLRGSAWL